MIKKTYLSIADFEKCLEIMYDSVSKLKSLFTE